MFGRRKVAALAAEFLGAGVLTLVYLSVQRSTIGVPYFVAAAAGLAMVMLLAIFGESSGAHANPAVTLALWTARKVETTRAALYILMQILGAWAAYGVYTYFVNSSLQTIGGTYTGRVLVAEAVGTFILGLGWAAVYFKSNLTAGARAGLIGVAYMLGAVVAAVAGIGVINPAVAQGIRAWEVFGSMGWGTYVLGPVLGAVIAVNLYGLLFANNDDSATAEEVVVSGASAASRSTRTARKPAAKKTAAKKTTTRRTTARRRA